MGDGKAAIKDNAEYAGAAQRFDKHLGIVETARFFGSGQDRLFGMTYEPFNRPVRGGVVICPPLLAQFNAHYRKGTLLARSLASAGLAVHRFHYRGTGNSDGDIGRMTLDSLVADTREATSLLVEAVGESPMGFIGVSLGAYPAAVASRDGYPLVLDSPPSSGRGFLRKALRSHAVAVMREGDSEPPDSKALIDRIVATDDVSLLGFRLSRSFYEDLQERELTEVIGPKPRDLLVVERNRSGELSREAMTLVGALTESAFRVETLISRKEDPFWYVDHSAPEEAPEVAEANRGIGDWLSSALTTGVRQP